MRPKNVVFALALLGGLIAGAAPASAGCSCMWQDMDDAAAPIEGLLVLPTDSCTNESRSMWLTDEDGVGVAGGIDTTIEAFPVLDALYWRTEAPLTPGASYKYYHVVKDSSRGFNSYGCETTASLTVRDDPFPEMDAPEAVISELNAHWVPEFECYAPSYSVTVTKHPDTASSRYERYTLSVVWDEEVNPIKWQVGGGSPSYEHWANWSTSWTGGRPYRDTYCIRSEAWEVVNGTRTSEDLCVWPEDLIGVETAGNAPDVVVPEDAALCDASVDINDPVDDPVYVFPDPDDPEAATGGGDGCSQGHSSGALPFLLWSLMVTLGAMRFRPRQV